MAWRQHNLNRTGLKHTGLNDRGHRGYFLYTLVAALLLAVVHPTLAAPANDHFAGARVITGQSGTVSGTTIDATREDGEPGNTGYATVWYRWTAPISRGFTFTTSGSNYDTHLSVWAGSTVNNLVPMGDNGNATTEEITSRVTFNAIANTTYSIAVGGNWQSGNLSLAWSPGPANDNFTGAQSISGQSGSVIGTTVGASRENGEPGQTGFATVWYRWTAPISRGFTFSTAGSSYDTHLSVWTGSTADNLASVGDNGDISLDDKTSRVTFNAIANTVYFIAVGGNWESGSVALSWTPGPVNDNFSGAGAISGQSGSIVATTEGASREANEPGPTGYATVWYRWTAPLSTTTIVSTAGSDFDTHLSVWTGTSLNSLAYLGDNSDVSGTDKTSRIAFSAVANTVYYLAIGGNWEWGNVVLNWGPPANDAFDNAQTLNGSTGSVIGTNLGTTRDPGEPNHAGIAGGVTVWYRWTALSNGSATFTTTGSAFDTVLAVYAPGTPVVWNGMRLVAGNDQDPEDTTGSGASRVTFTAVAGTTYFIAVDGFGGATGRIVLNWSSPPSTTYSISGRITTNAGVGLGGVSVARTGSVTRVATNASGDYSFVGLVAGTYTITPALAGYKFTPVSRNVSVGTANVVDQGFTATPDIPPPTISGFSPVRGPVGTSVVITGSNLAGASTVRFSGINASFTVNSATQITATVPAGATSGALSVATPGGTATSANAFVVTAPNYTISGRIANHSGTGIPNVYITRTNGASVVTNASGEFAFTNVAPGTYTIAPLITPSLQGVSLYPASRNVTVSNVNVSNQLFQASFSVSGRVANHSGVGIPNVQVKRVAGASVVSTFTDSNGNYKFTDVRSGSYTLSPVLTPAMNGMSFTPAATNLTVATANITNQNFIGMFSVSGTIKTSTGTALANVLVRLSNGSTSTTVQTDSLGSYKFSGVRSGTYSITPTLSGRTFTPATRSGVVVSTLNIGNQNFTGSG